MVGGRATEPGIWDGMVDERDGEESGARVEMWLCEEAGAWKKVQGNYSDEVKDETAQGQINLSGTSEMRKVRRSIEVKIRRGKGAEYVRDGNSDLEHEFSCKLHEMFEKIGRKEIKAQELFIPGAKDDPCSHL